MRAISQTIAVCAASLVLGAAVIPGVIPGCAAAEEGGQILSRHIGTSRARAAERPRSEGDQAIVAGWPLYRTERGQSAYNAAMATLAATEGRAPSATHFERCPDLTCDLSLPSIAADGWLPAGRIWTSPKDYVLIAHSPRPGYRRAHRRHGPRGMRYFVFHEFHNSSRNTDTYDTISSHSGAVFVPFYLSKPAIDAHGRRFVVIVQVAPYDTVSVHATNYGSAGPGVEVAKNATDDLDALQARAGVVLATVVKRAAPQVRVVNHRGREGLGLLEAYEARLAGLKSRRVASSLALPFVPARAERIASVSGPLADLITPRGASPRLAIAERRFVPPRAAIEPPTPPPTHAEAALPQLVGPVQLARRPTRMAFPILVEPVRLATQR